MAGLTYEEFSAREQQAEACGADEFEQSQLAHSQVDAHGRSEIDNKINAQYKTDKYQSVREKVAQCYNGQGEGIQPGDDTPFLERMIGKAKDAFSSAASGVSELKEALTPQLVRDVDDALDKAGTEDSLQNQRWERQINQSMGPGL